MKRLPITQEERLFLLSIEKNAVLILLMFKVYPMPINADSLAFDFKWERRKATRMLDDLSSDGFTALMKGQGYVLTSQTRSMVVQFFGNLISFPLEAQALAPESQAQAQTQALEGVMIVSSVETDDAHGARALGVGESLTTEFKTDSPTPTQSAHFVRWPTTEKIIAATPILFGEPGVVRGQLEIEELSPRYTLAVIAHCYDLRKTPKNSKGLFAPAGMAYKMLVQDKQPRAEYLKDPKEYLPADYLEVLGLAEYTCPACEVIFTASADLAKHELEHAPVGVERFELPAPSVVPIPSISLDDNARRIWSAVQDQLRTDMPRATFDSWVRDAAPVSYDGQILRVGVHDTFACDWLEGRLASTVNRLLIGICNAEVVVEFVVAEFAEE